MAAVTRPSHCCTCPTVVRAALKLCCALSHSQYAAVPLLTCLPQPFSPPIFPCLPTGMIIDMIFPTPPLSQAVIAKLDEMMGCDPAFILPSIEALANLCLTPDQQVGPHCAVLLLVGCCELFTPKCLPSYHGHCIPAAIARCGGSGA